MQTVPTGRTAGWASHRSSFVAILAALGIAGGALPAAAEVACGDTIGPWKDVVLQADLRCDDVATALVVMGPATLDLNGFTIHCADRNGNGREPSAGIAARGFGARVRNGIVEGCGVGVDVGGSGNHTVRDVAVLFSASDGIRIASDRNQVENSFALFSGESGFAIEGELNVLSGNGASENPLGFVVSRANVLEKNVAIDSELIGFVVASTGSALAENHALRGPIGFDVLGDDNGFIANRGEHNGTGFFVDSNATGNVLLLNIVSGSHGSGFAVAGDRNQLFQSRAERNGTNGIQLVETASGTIVTASVSQDNGAADVVDHTSGCGTNSWRDNTFGSSNDPCIE
jgi:hypothetical protein